jgi:SnoaL-like domain
MPIDQGQISDRLAIQDTLLRYCHGIDRIDLETLKSAYWDDATHDIGTGPVPAHTFCAGTLAALAAMQITQHVLSNTMIRFGGAGHANAQSTVVAYHQFDSAAGATEMVVGGRYLDRLEQRSGIWRIKSRLYVMDWNRNAPSTMQWSGGLYDKLGNRGARFPDDLSKDFV